MCPTSLHFRLHQGNRHQPSDQFREDLWFRLNVFPIVVPPLRVRKSDIPALVNHFIERKTRELNLAAYPDKSPDALQQLQAYHRPGNVCELENLIERASIKSRTTPSNTLLAFDDLLPLNKETDHDQQKPKTPGKIEANPFSLNLDEANRQIIQTALNMTEGKIQGKKGAAAISGINPNTLRNRMQKLGMPYGRKLKQKD